MSWRLGTPTYWRYAQLCPECGLHRGWPARQSAETHKRELMAAGLGVDAAYPDEYTDGADGTCPHGASAPEPKKVTRPIAKRRRGAVG